MSFIWKMLFLGRIEATRKKGKISGKKSKVINVQEVFIPCPHCQQWPIKLIIKQQFFHLCGIPTVPLKKEAFFECSGCETQTSAKLEEVQPSVIKAIKTPWWSFSGMGIGIILIGLIIGYINYHEKQIKELINKPEIGKFLICKNEMYSNVPYYGLKIIKIKNEKITYRLSKLLYSSLFYAWQDSSSKNYFREEAYEMNLDKFKKLEKYNVGSIRR